MKCGEVVQMFDGGLILIFKFVFVDNINGKILCTFTLNEL